MVRSLSPRCRIIILTTGGCFQGAEHLFVLASPSIRLIQPRSPQGFRGCLLEANAVVGGGLNVDMADPAIEAVGDELLLDGALPPPLLIPPRPLSP